MATQWPLIAAHLVAVLPTLPGWSQVDIYDGPPVGDGVADVWCSVGYVAGDDHAGNYTTAQDPNGFQIQETGYVRSQITATTGDVDLPGMRGKVFALADAVDAYIRADRRLGDILAPRSTSGLEVDIHSVQQSDGAIQTLVFTVHYFTVT